MSKAWPVPDVDPDGDVATNARRILAVRVAEFYAWAPAADRDEASEALHELRIAAKRLRYTLELFKRQFGDAGSRQIDRIKAVQEELGELHDHDVRIALIEEELRGLAVEQADEVARDLAGADPQGRSAVAASALRPALDDPKRGLLALLNREHDRRAERYRRFRTLWQDLSEANMRADLVGLSVRPLGDTGQGIGPAPGASPENVES